MSATCIRCKGLHTLSVTHRTTKNHSKWCMQHLSRDITFNACSQPQKISLLTHDPASHLPSSSGAPAQTSRNLDPLQHPHARARERKRALNATKLERMFAQPFVAAFEGHADSVTCLERVPGVLSAVASASHDGGGCCGFLFSLARWN